MSLVTRCPACATTFKVVRDQLRISDGWVRCGRCSNVFDATLDLHESSDGPQADVTATAPPAASALPAEPGLTHASAEPSYEEPHRVEPVQPPMPSAQGEAQALHGPEDADFFDDEPEQASDEFKLPQQQEEAAVPTTQSSPAPEPGIEYVEAAAPPPWEEPPSSQPPTSSSVPAPDFVLPAHGIMADEPWSDLDVTEPEWRPPASSLPPFPNIDLNLAAPPQSPPPPAPPLPVARAKPHALVEPALDDGEGAKSREEKDKEKEHDQVQMQKALRRARIKSAKIASANKSREARAAAKAAPVVVREASEPELTEASLPPIFAQREEDHPFADDEEHDAVKAEDFWQRKGVRLLLALLVVLTLLLLVVQIVRHERDGIVARQPNLRPALTALCQYTGCELSALRQIGDIVIEGAAFAREKSGSNDYRLSFTLRNGATVPLAMPAVELSLLDTQERAVVRRVLLPADYGAPSVLPPRADRAASLPLTLSPTEAAALPPIAGYRVEAFYP